MDKVLLTRYAEAVRSRPLLQRLPDGLREYALRFERMCLEDIRAQTGNPNLTEQEILKETEPTVIKIIAEAWPLLSPLILELVKKYFPAMATSGALAAVITYLTTH